MSFGIHFDLNMPFIFYEFKKIVSNVYSLEVGKIALF